LGSVGAATETTRRRWPLKISAHRLGRLYGTSEACSQGGGCGGVGGLRLRGPRNLHSSRTATPFRRDAPDALRHLRRPRGRRGVSATAMPSQSSPTSDVTGPSHETLIGAPLTGTWFDRTKEYAARRRRGENPDPLQYTRTETVILSPLPRWDYLAPEAYRQRVASLAEEIEQDTAAARKRTGAEPLGTAAIPAQDPTSRPKRLKKSPAPLFHAASKAMRHYLYEGFAWFVAAYRTAAEKLQRGDPDPHFPRGSFPPALPFVSG
jgi:hypothetical protein